MSRRLIPILCGVLMYSIACDEASDSGVIESSDSLQNRGIRSPGVGGTDKPDAKPTATNDLGGAVEKEIDTPPRTGPWAWVYQSNPFDTPDLSMVLLQHLTSGDKSLVGKFARVRNCLPNKENGAKSLTKMPNGLEITLTTCVPVHAAVADDNGTYLHIEPPYDHGTDDDSFAEIMMYHHIQKIHDYFSEKHQLSDLDFPLDAVVNLQFNIDAGVVWTGPSTMPKSTDCDEWVSLANAAFLPKGTIDQFGVPLDLGITGGAIVFGQLPNKDFSYDADVIYHEYTHAMIGTTRLSAVFIDDEGLNNMPGALNEAYADYFAATLADDSVIGNYALGGAEGGNICNLFSLPAISNRTRDLSQFRRCPENLTTQVHADGEIFGSALWAIRNALGAEKADALILKALMSFTNSTGFSLAAQLTIDAAKETLSAAEIAVVEKVFQERGLVDCQRVIPVKMVGMGGVPIKMYGVDGGHANPYGNYYPGFAQFGLSFEGQPKQMTVVVSTNSDAVDGATVLFSSVFKPGKEHIKYTGSNGPVSHDGVIQVPFSKMNSGSYGATLAGKCLATSQNWVFSIHNQASEFSIKSIAVKTSSQVTRDLNFNSCP